MTGDCDTKKYAVRSRQLHQQHPFTGGAVTGPEAEFPWTLTASHSFLLILSVFVTFCYTVAVPAKVKWLVHSRALQTPLYEDCRWNVPVSLSLRSH